MSAHVLLNLLNKWGKRDKMRGLPSILSLFRNEFNKFNNTKARMLDYIYHMTNTLNAIIQVHYMGLDVTKPVFGGLRQSGTQTRLLSYRD